MHSHIKLRTLAGAFVAALILPLLLTGCGRSAPCGIPCPTGYVCVDGRCELICTSGTTNCSGKCTNTQTDPNNCGKCGNACKTGQACVAGKCAPGWATSFGGLTRVSAEYIYDVDKDSAGNTYVMGKFFRHFTIGATTLDSKGYGSGVFVAKFNASGKVVWAAKGVSTFVNSRALALDSAGNVYITGNFNGKELVLGGNILKNSSTNADLFVAKLNSNGTWAWAAQSSGTALELGGGVAVDSSGNTFVSGSFTHTSSDSAQIGATKLHSAGHHDLFVAKLDSAGKWLWAKSAGGLNGEHGYDLAVDSAGNAVVTGTYTGSAKFGSLSLTGDKSSDIFVAMIDDAGAWKWVTSAGSSINDYGVSIVLDSADNAHVTGRHGNGAKFGASISLKTAGSSPSNSDTFVAKIDKTGKWLWAATGGSAGKDEPHDVDLDKAGNVYISGFFSATGTYGATTLTSKGPADALVAKLDSTGKWVWARSVGGAKDDSAHGVAVHGAGASIMVGGAFDEAATFGATSLTSRGRYDAFLATLNSTGAVTAAQSFGGINSASDAGRDLARDSAGNTYVVGSFQGDVTLGSSTLKSVDGKVDIFIGKLDSAGKWLWARSAGGKGEDYGIGIALDGSSNVYIAGHFRTLSAGESATFGASKLQSNGDTDTFVAKLDRDGNWLWAKAAGGSGADNGQDLDLDGSGNAYLAGYFHSPDAKFGSHSLKTRGGDDAFVAMIDSAGTWKWARQAGSTGADYCHGVTVDSAGNAHVTGGAYNGALFGSKTLHGKGSRDLFVAKIDKTGKWIWVTSGGGSSSDVGQSVAVDSAGKIAVSGSMGSSSGTFGATSLAGLGGSDIVVGMLDRSGKWLWAKGAGGSEEDFAYGVAMDSSSNVYLTGNIAEQGAFGSLSLAGLKDNESMFLAKLDRDGKWLWVKGATKPTSLSYGYGIVPGAGGTVYVTGEFRGKNTFGNTTLDSEGYGDLFVWMVLP